MDKVGVLGLKSLGFFCFGVILLVFLLFYYGVRKNSAEKWQGGLLEILYKLLALSVVSEIKMFFCVLPESRWGPPGIVRSFLLRFHRKTRGFLFYFWRVLVTLGVVFSSDILGIDAYWGLLLGILMSLIDSSARSPAQSLYKKHLFVSNCLVLTLLGGLMRSFQFGLVYEGYIIHDRYALDVQWYLIVCTVFFLLVTLEYLLRYSYEKKINLVELPVVVCFALFFMLLLVSSFNVFGAYVSLEGITFSLYILGGMNYNSQNSLEAGMKYFCLGAMSSGVLLFGIALIFIMTKTLGFLELRFLFNELNDLPLLLSFALIFIFFGFWFKLSIFPCHAWTPDVYEGVLTPITLFFATVVKLGVFTFFVRVLFFLLGSKLFLFFWQPFFLFVATGSIAFGAFGALVQTKIKRFVGYTTVNQMGYLFIGVSSGDLLGLQASFLYLFFYLVMGFSFFSILLYINDFNTGRDVLFINQLTNFGSRHRNLSVGLVLVLFSMAGIPPLAGFFGKFFLFFSAFKAGNQSLIFFGLAMNVVSAFYYLRLVKCIFFESEREPSHLFFLGRGHLWPKAFYSILGLLFFSLLTAPFFLYDTLPVFERLAVSAACIHSR
jgi:NADH-quinone oxidoreductase subunit N